MSLTKFEQPSLKDKLEEQAAKVETPTPKAVKTKKVEKLGAKKKGNK
jgi:hypothetical protein